jgi:hypothetical protein
LNEFIIIALTPKIKEQNRINASAFTEHKVILYSEKEQKEDYATHSGGGKATLEALCSFSALSNPLLMYSDYL